MDKRNVLIVLQQNQYEWLKENCLNISAFFRLCLDEKIELQKGGNNENES